MANYTVQSAHLSDVRCLGETKEFTTTVTDPWPELSSLGWSPDGKQVSRPFTSRAELVREFPQIRRGEQTSRPKKGGGVNVANAHLDYALKTGNKTSSRSRFSVPWVRTGDGQDTQTVCGALRIGDYIKVKEQFDGDESKARGVWPTAQRSVPRDAVPQALPAGASCLFVDDATTISGSRGRGTTRPVKVTIRSTADTGRRLQQLEQTRQFNTISDAASSDYCKPYFTTTGRANIRDLSKLADNQEALMTSSPNQGSDMAESSSSNQRGPMEKIYYKSLLTDAKPDQEPHWVGKKAARANFGTTFFKQALPPGWTKTIIVGFNDEEGSQKLDVWQLSLDPAQAAVPLQDGEDWDVITYKNGRNPLHAAETLLNSCDVDSD